MSLAPANMDDARAARLLAFAVPAALLGGAYLGQYAFGLYPCEMCWWQRYAHFAALALAAAHFAWDQIERIFPQISPAKQRSRHREGQRPRAAGRRCAGGQRAHLRLTGAAVRCSV